MINKLVAAAHKTAVEHGWHEEDKGFGEQVALMHSELSEALEEYRQHGNKKGCMTHIYYSGKSGGLGFVSKDPTEICKKPEGIPVELADVIIRIFDTCGKYGIDLGEAIRIKMEFNEGREYRHGGKVI